MRTSTGPSQWWLYWICRLLQLSPLNLLDLEAALFSSEMLALCQQLETGQGMQIWRFSSRSLGLMVLGKSTRNSSLVCQVLAKHYIEGIIINYTEKLVIWYKCFLTFLPTLSSGSSTSTTVLLKNGTASPIRSKSTAMNTITSTIIIIFKSVRIYIYGQILLYYLF